MRCVQAVGLSQMIDLSPVAESRRAAELRYEALCALEGSYDAGLSHAAELELSAKMQQADDSGHAVQEMPTHVVDWQSGCGEHWSHDMRLGLVQMLMPGSRHQHYHH